MPEDCIFLFDLRGGGGGQGAGAGAGANRSGVIPFCAIKNEGLHKIVQSFLKGHVFFCNPISILKNQKHVKWCFFFFFFLSKHSVSSLFTFKKETCIAQYYSVIMTSRHNLLFNELIDGKNTH